MTPVLSLPSFTGNRNNIDIFLYNWRALCRRQRSSVSLSVSLQHAGLTATEAHSVTCQQAEVTFSPLPQSYEAGILDFSDFAGAMASWLSWLGYIPRWYTHTKMVTHPSTNRGQRRITSFMRRTSPYRPIHGTVERSIVLAMWRQCPP